MSDTIRAVDLSALDLVTEAPDPAWIRPVVRLNRRLGAMPMVRGNTTTLITGYTAELAALTSAVESARYSVHLQTYILSLDETTAEFFDALTRAVRRGVTVRVLLDHIGSWRSPTYRATIGKLASAGIDWHLMLPVQPLRGRYQRPDLRNHRKAMIVDGERAFVGSLNIIDASYNKRANLRRGLQWTDVLVELGGPVVYGIEAVFATDWYSETGNLLGNDNHPDDPRGFTLPPTSGPSDCQVVPSGPGFPDSNNLKLFNSLIYGAQHRICITSPYLVPDESLLQAITSAAGRGVDIDVIVCEVGDQTLVHHAQSSYYGTLLEAGARIWLYPFPDILHVKHITVDDSVTVIGSSNMDIRSFLLNLEISLLVCGEDFTTQVRASEDDYRSSCRELTLSDWLARPRRTRILDNLARLTSALQ